MLGEQHPSSRLDAKRREQTPQALARLALLLLFMSLWGLLWLLRIPMPFPFLLLLFTEALFFIAYWRVVSLLPNVRTIEMAHYVMLGAEIIFHTSMVYFLGGVSWLGSFAYVFGLIFSNAFLDLRRGLVYTSGASLAFTALIVLEATGTIPHYVYLEQGPLRYTDTPFVATTLVGAAGVFFSIYAWVNWVGYQLRLERDSAIRAQGDLLRARAALQQTNEDLEERVKARTAELELANAALRDSEQQLHLVLETCPDLISIQEPDARYRFVNIAFTDVLGYKADQLLGQSPAELVHPDDREDVRERFRTMVSSGRPAEATYRFRHADGHWVVIEANGQVLVDGEGQPTGVVVVQRDVTERKRAESLLAEQRRVLEMVAVGAALEEVLETLVLLIEEQGEGVLCSVLLVNDDGTALIPSAAPSLPERYNEGLKQGVPISPTAGSCGTAAYRRQPIIVSDIGSDPLWDDYRGLALNDGLQACWSTPIFSSTGDVLGTFAMYYREPRSPDAHEHVLVAAATHIAGIAIERKRAEEALRESEERFRSLAENSFDLICEADADARFSYLSPNYKEVVGYAPEELLGAGIFDLIHPEDRPAVAEEFGRAVGTRTVGQAVFRHRHKNGEWRWFESAGRAFETQSGELRAAIISRDITERRRAEEALQESEETLKATIESTADGILVVGHDGQVAYANARFAEMWRIPASLLETRDDNKLLAFVLDQLHDPEAFLSKVHELYQSPREDLDTLAFKEGRVFERYSRPLMIDGQTAGRVWSFRDVTERKRAEEALREAANHDPLTGLLNRRAGLAAIEERLEHAKNTSGRFAVLVLDLDVFKSINDSFSHETGDAALVRFAQVMNELVGGNGVICRLGGDEFEIGLDGASLEQALVVAEELRRSLHRSLRGPGASLPEFKVSTGVACYPEDGATPAELGRHADAAMYAAKAAGGDRCHAWRRQAPRQAA